MTLAGDRHAARVGVSLLNAAGHSEWATSSWPEYIQTACDLARDGMGLERLHDSLSGEFFASELCQTRRFVQRVEAAYRTMWQQWCDTSSDDDRE